jgi:hypothetical protein
MFLSVRSLLYVSNTCQDVYFGIYRGGTRSCYGNYTRCLKEDSMDRSATPSRVAYALQKSGLPLARTRATRGSGAVVKADGPSVVVRYYDARSHGDPTRTKRFLDRAKAQLQKQGHSVTAIPDEAALRIL